MRTVIDFNHHWQFIKHAYSVEDAEIQMGEVVRLPHTWNAKDGQDGGNDYHRGKCWYVKKFTPPSYKTSDRVYLELLGASMTTEIYMNQVKVMRHCGGYSTFRVDVTDFLKEENTLVITVDNTENKSVYPQKADFTFYGGIYRDVNLIVVPESHFALDYYGTPGIKVTPVVNLDLNRAEVTVEAWIKGKSDSVNFKVAEMQLIAPVVEGYSKAVFILENVHLWNGLEDPYLYSAKATLTSGDEVIVRFGCRQFEMHPQKGFILNGKPYLLRGVSLHQDQKDVGNAVTLEMQNRDLAIIKELGATTLRLAHYQHSQTFYDLCDENGLIVWAEIPYITMHMAEGRDNTLFQMEALVVQNYNHPSIICWGLSNEITAASVVNEDLLENHRMLNDICHRLDATRPTTLANVFMLEIESPLLEIPDINSYNLYFGWYLGDLIQNDQFFDDYHTKFPDRCIGFSEYGADANPKYQSSTPEKGDYTESYQAVYHEHMLNMIEERPWLWSTHVWNLFDFAADGRDEGGKHGENQKGLVTFDRKIKKDAFYLYKAAWNKQEPFVHICGSRYKYRSEKVTEIKVYSNQTEVTLWMDGNPLTSLSGKVVFSFKMPIEGNHTFKVTAGAVFDQIEVSYVDEPYADYIFNKKNNINNWFDSEELDTECYSISDTLGDLRSNPRTAAIIDSMMAKNAQSRGDVADAVKDNPALVRMMERITLVSLLKQAGAEAEDIKHLNRILQGIKKCIE